MIVLAHFSACKHLNPGVNPHRLFAPAPHGQHGAGIGRLDQQKVATLQRIAPGASTDRCRRAVLQTVERLGGSQEGHIYPRLPVRGAQGRHAPSQ